MELSQDQIKYYLKTIEEMKIELLKYEGILKAMRVIIPTTHPRIKPFLDACIINDTAAHTPHSLLYSAYLSWCVSNQTAPLTSKGFSFALDAAGFQRGVFYEDRCKCRGWIGLKLKTPPLAPQNPPQSLNNTQVL